LVPSCANKGLLTDLARETWDFDGYITTDCGAADYVGGFLRKEGFPSSPADTVRAVLEAGVDTDCGGGGTPNWSNETLLRLMTETSTSATITPLIDASLRRLFTVRMRLGHFDDPALQPWGSYSLERVDTPAHRELAMDAALQGFVLLMNERSALPLTTAKLAVLGPNIKSGVWQLGNYHEKHWPHDLVVSPCQGLQQNSATQQVTCVVPDGCKIGGNASCFDSASAAAVAAADAVVLFVGLDGSQEAEGHDKMSLLLPGTQQEMVDAATAAVAADGFASASKKPVVVVVMGGSAVDLSSIKANPVVDAIVWVGYPGQAGGDAIAKALYGDENKWGKSPFTWYDESFCHAANLNDYRMRPDAQGYPGRTHRFYTGSPVFEFGAGLSLTSFERSLKWQQPSGVGTALVLLDELDEPESVVATMEVRVTNTGRRAGDEVLMLFVEPPSDAVALGAPRQQLAAFARVSLAAGETTTLPLQITQRHLQLGTASGAGQWRARINHDQESALPFSLVSALQV